MAHGRKPDYRTISHKLSAIRSSISSRRDVPCELAQGIGLGVEGLQMADGPLDALVREGAGALDAVEGRVGLLAPLGVGVGVLAEFFARPDDVQHVVGDLKGQ